MNKHDSSTFYTCTVTCPAFNCTTINVVLISSEDDIAPQLRKLGWILKGDVWFCPDHSHKEE